MARVLRGDGRKGMNGLTQKIHSIVAEQLGVDACELVPEASLLDDLGADSLDVVELVMAIEEAFGIEVPDEDAENIRTIADICEYVEARAENAA